MTAARRIEGLLKDRFGEEVPVDPAWPGLDRIEPMVKHRVIRRYSGQAVGADLIRLICACALSAPSKSDLQQRDIVVVENPGTRREIADLIPDMPWIGQAPAFVVFLANGRRLPEIARLRGKPFPNDHFDLVFNAATDAAIALATAVTAAEAMGLGACPISVIRAGDPLRRSVPRLARRRGPAIAAAPARHDPAPRPLRRRRSPGRGLRL